MWGYAATPVLNGNLCFVNFGPGDRSFLIALDKRTGKTVWQSMGVNFEDCEREPLHLRRVLSTERRHSGIPQRPFNPRTL
jgi:hypothetical protein